MTNVARMARIPASTRLKSSVKAKVIELGIAFMAVERETMYYGGNAPM
jgi:hypothetical protein